MGDNLPVVDFGGGRRATDLIMKNGQESGWSCAVFTDGDAACVCGANGDPGFHSCPAIRFQGDYLPSQQSGYGDKWGGSGSWGSAPPNMNLGTGTKVAKLIPLMAGVGALLEGGDIMLWGQNHGPHLMIGVPWNNEYRGQLDSQIGDNAPVLDWGSGQKAVALWSNDAQRAVCALLDDDTTRCWGTKNSAVTPSGISAVFAMPAAPTSTTSWFI